MKVCPTCNTEFADTERFCPRDGASLRSLTAATDLVGTVIADRYHVIRKLGEGGMGQVYLAEHVRMRRKSAVKVIHPTMTHDAEAVGRFNREAANACQIQHPNVAAIYDFGESDGIVYLAMEYVEGLPLSRLLVEHGALPISRAADITKQVADGLEVAHHLGIVHRDLKPENILVGRHFDGRDAVKVVDFGISKAARADGQTVTRTGMIVGTPDYMSPEQLAGDPLDRRSDIYSLGIVTFNMLTGQLPFQAKSAHTSMLMRLTEPPKRLDRTRPDIGWPMEVQTVLDRAMALEPGDRFSTAAEFGDALMAAARAAPVESMGEARTVVAPATTKVSHTATTVRTLVAPREATAAVSPAFSAEELSAIEAKLAKAVGPIAKILVKRAATTSATREALVSALAREIDDDKDREQFRRSVL